MRIQKALFARAMMLLAAGLAAALTAMQPRVLAAPVDPVSRYHVTWDSPSADHRGSMPLGNGDIGLNAWIEPSGDLIFYIAKTDSWDDNARLVKVGRVRVSLTPAPVLHPFRQELSLRDGTMNVRFGDGATLRVWVDANQPVVHVESSHARPVVATAALELWRTNRYELPSIETSDVMLDRARPKNMHAPTIVEPDTILTGLSGRIGWYHHNSKSVGPAEHAAVQGMTGYARAEPLLHRTFGAVITAEGGRRLDDAHLESASARQHAFRIHVLTRHPSSPAGWLKAMDELVSATARARAGARAAHERWWRDFWDRSWIHATINPDAPKSLASLFPSNPHPLRVGEDQARQNKFAGDMRELKTPATLGGSFTLEAEVKPVAGERGRIFDKLTPGRNDGFLIDAHPGNSLRLISGATEVVVKDALPAGRWARVVAVASPEGWHISVDGRTVIDTTRAAGADEAAYVSQMYALQRFITACAGRGQHPIKFNGSIFTVPSAGAPGDADYRRWGPGYWWQNTRLPYLSLCASGDFEMLEPLWRMYVDQLLPLNRHRTKQYFGFENAAYYIECVHFWGDVFNETYGWKPVSERTDPLQESGWHKREWVAGPELVWMLLDHYEHVPDKDLLERRIVPAATAVMRFFDLYYQTNAAGQLVMHPSQSLETWWDCTNPMPEVAGLRAIAARLLALPERSVPTGTRAYWREFAARIPPLPTREVQGGRVLAAAEKFAHKSNVENPEFYAVFPFRLCSFEKDNRGLGLNALPLRGDKGNFGWRQDDLFMAYLGLADASREHLVGRARNHDRGSRFPAFWGPNYDWIPDQDHGGVLMKTFQSMLLQTDGRKIFLLPAWPKGWDCEFKLHAPYQTILEGRVSKGRVTGLKVTPEARRADVTVVPPQPAD